MGVAGFAGELDAATGGEAAADEGLAGGGGGDEVVEDAVDDGFVEGGVVAVGGEVEFEGFGFDAEGVGDVEDLDVGGVGLTGDGAEGGEVGGAEVDGVVAARGAIGEGFEAGFVRGGGEAVLGAAEEVEGGGLIGGGGGHDGGESSGRWGESTGEGCVAMWMRLVQGIVPLDLERTT